MIQLPKTTSDGVTQTWQYDANGNRTHEDGVQVASYDAQDRLTQYKDNTYQYNALGQLTQKTTPSGTKAYDYDVFGNLRRVNLANGINIEYLIDPKDRRIGKKVNGVIKQKLLYLGQLNPIAELYPGNSVKNLFIFADKSNVPSAMERYDESGNLTGKYRIISNHLGSVVMVVNAETGDIAQEIEYDVWGNVLNDTNPDFQPFYFAGGLYDSDTKLTRFGVRDYDAETGRWTAKDPIGFNGGLTSLYDYVGGNPIMFVDPLGLEKLNLLDCSDKKNAVMCRAVEKSPDTKGTCLVYGHGSKDNHTINSTNTSDSAIPIEDVADKINKVCGDIPVQLMSCWGGTGGDDSPAQKLADETGGTVSGYDGYVLYTSGGPFGFVKPDVRPVKGVNNVTKRPSTPKPKD